MTKNICKSLLKHLPELSTETAEYDGKLVKKLSTNLGVVAETFLKAKRETKRGKELDAKTLRIVVSFLDALFSEANSNAPSWLVSHLAIFPPESRQYIYHIINYINRHDRTRALFCAKLCMTDCPILLDLASNFADENIGGICSEIFQELIRQEDVCRKVLHTPAILNPFFLHAQSRAFEITANAFTSLKTLVSIWDLINIM